MNWSGDPVQLESPIGNERHVIVEPPPDAGGERALELSHRVLGVFAGDGPAVGRAEQLLPHEEELAPITEPDRPPPA
jgi:hypothetical protein